MALGVRVLVADDEPVIRAALEDLIEANPILEFVGAAADAQEAIDQTASLHPDVVLLDVRMPRGGGPRAAAEIDAMPDPPRTVAFSAYDDRSAILSMLESGACGYLVKGAPNADIVRTLTDAGRRESRKGAADAAMPGESVRVVLADEPGTARSALALLLESRPEFDLAGVAGNAAEALRLACIHRPRTALIGRTLPGDSSTAIREIRQAVPDLSVVAYTTDPEPRGVREAVEAGAMSYIVRDEQDEEIVEALRAAARGRSVLSAAAASAVVDELSVAPGAVRERHRRSRRRARLERYVRGDGLSVVVQPIFDLASGTPTAFEALARFNGGGSEGPSVWFAEAADEGLGAALELAAARAALGVLHELPGDVLLGINVSPHVAALPEFAAMVRDLPSRRVVLELTEHAAVEDYAGLSSAFGELRARGLRVAVDDAGAGFASLRHVLMIEPDYLKLDISLCRGIARDRRRRALARALVAFARETDIETIAEGVESADDLEVLRDIGVQYAQGYHLASPGPPGSWRPRP